MIDVMENIKKLSAALDAETASLHPSGKLLLLGSQDSVFLKAIKRKADQLGINCDHTSNPLPPYRGIVVDTPRIRKCWTPLLLLSTSICVISGSLWVRRSIARWL